MLRWGLVLALACGGAVLAGCQPLPPDSAHTAQNALDWAGRYEGVLPCASCMGLKTELTLASDGTYRMVETYLGKSKRLHSSGRFIWDQAGGGIQLRGDQDKRRFKVGEGRLWVLDTEGQLITGPLEKFMILTKV